MGEDMVMAFAVMFTFGVGTSAVLLAAGLASTALLMRVRPGIMAHAGRGKQLLGGLLILLGAMVLFGFDKQLEIWALSWLPDWAVTL
jgi:sulfite exporter TauE/SafE